MAAMQRIFECHSAVVWFGKKKEENVVCTFPPICLHTLERGLLESAGGHLEGIEE